MRILDWVQVTHFLNLLISVMINGDKIQLLKNILTTR